MSEVMWVWDYELKTLGSWPSTGYNGHNTPVEVVTQMDVKVLRDERDRLKAVLELVGEQEFLDTLAMALHHEHCLTDASYAEHFVKHPNEIDTAWAADGRNRALWYGRARITIRVMLAQIKAALTPGGQRLTPNEATE